MFIGHLAIGFASKRVLPRESLPVLLAAPLFLDLLWPVFLATGLESVHIDPGNTAVTPLDLHDFPYSHSLLMAVAWSVLFGLGFFALRRDARAGVILGGSVFSHWLLDFLAHAPDLPLYPGSSTYLGLGLWNSVAGTLLVEGTLFALGVALYVTATRPKTRGGTWLLASLVVVLTGIYLGSVFGPPPPNVTAIIVSDFAVLVFFAWAYAVDRRRVT